MSKKCGLIALLGEANAGKSTLVNALTGEKVSIVSSKPHTTRHGIFGIVCRDDTQLVFIDTPGLIDRPQGPVQSFMSRMTKKSARDADVCVIVIDVGYPVTQSVQNLLERLKERNLIIILNKVDTVTKEKLLPITEFCRTWTEKIVMTSALKNKGVDYVFDLLRDLIPEGPWLFDSEDLTQVSQRFWAAEITREKLFECVHHEVPYHTNVVTDQWVEKGKEIVIRQSILVDQERYRKWILGYEGKRIKRIGHQSRLEMTDHLQKNVHLFLTVVVDKSWFDRLQNT